jgi:hypothetical protein
MPRENENDVPSSAAANGATRPSTGQESSDTSSVPATSAISDNGATPVTQMSVNDVGATSPVQVQATSSDNMTTPPVNAFNAHAVADADRASENDAQPEPNNNVPQQPQQQQHPLFNVRDRLFHALFQRIAFAYARSVPRHVRIALECFALFKAVMVLFVLIYIHAVFARGPINCLQHIQKDWPRDGILRVEIIRNAIENYSLAEACRAWITIRVRWLRR